MTTPGTAAMAMAPQETEATVLSALQVLYQKQLQPEQQQAADAFLRDFQLLPEAFPLCAHLLDRFLPQVRASPDSVPVVFFAAQTLANKLRRQQAPLDAGAYVGWTQKLLGWLTHNPAPPRLVQTQLTLALVACLPRISDQELLDAKPMNQSHSSHGSGALAFVLQELLAAPGQGSVLAELLGVIVEEACEIPDRALRERMTSQVDEWAGAVLDQLLPQVMQEAMQEPGATSPLNVATQNQVLRAVKNWVRYVHVSPDVVLRSPLVQAIVSFVANDELLESAVDLVVEIVRCYCDLERDGRLIQWLVPQLMGLRDSFQRAAAEEDTDRCRALCRIFTEMAESYMQLLLGDEDLNQTVVVDLVLDCMSCNDSEIADVTVPFWFRFMEELSMLDRPVRRVQLAKFTPCLLRLASTCMQNLQFHEDFPRLPLDKQADFKAFRQELGEILRECCALVGVQPVLQSCVGGLERIFQASDNERHWEAIEAHLYCFRSIARRVEKASDSANDASVQLIFQHLAQFSDHPAIRYTACLIVSRYAEWLRQHSQFLPAQLEFLDQCVRLSMQDPRYTEWEVPRAAATAMRSLAMDCWDLVGDQMLQFYRHCEQQHVMVVADQVLLLEGICAGVSKLQDVGLAIDLLGQVAEPIIARLTRLLEHHATAPIGSEMVMSEMLRLMCIYDYLDVSASTRTADQRQPLLMLTEQAWPLFHQALGLFRSNDDIVEGVCRCYKRMLHTCGRQFKPFVPQMADNLVSFYQTEPKSSYLYAGSMILKYFHDDQSSDMLALFAKMIRAFANTTFPIFQDLATVQTHPDVVEEFFFLMERVIKCAPQVLTDAPDPLLPLVFHSAVLSLQICHNDANKGALCLLEQAFKIAVAPPTPDVARTTVSNIVRQCVDSQAAHGGRELVVLLLNGVVLGALPPSRVDADYGSVAGVMVQMAKLDGARLQDWLAEWFQAGHHSQALTFIVHDESIQFQHELFASPDERTFRRTLRHFGRLCGSRTASSDDQDD